MVSEKDLKVATAKYPAGIYFVKLKSASNFQVRKLIIQ
jgi:hypothetical protein